MPVLSLPPELFPVDIPSYDIQVFVIPGDHDIGLGPLDLVCETDEKKTFTIDVCCVDHLKFPTSDNKDLTCLTEIHYIRRPTDDRRGCFIVLDGVDGSSKSTQIQALKNLLKDQGYDVITTREPGGSVGAEEVRSLVVNGEPGRWDGISELMLFSAARRNHVQTVIMPALKEGKIVLCDRFTDSTVAYQGYGQGVPFPVIDVVTHVAIGDFRPDLTILMFIDPELGYRRVASRRGAAARFESFDSEFQNRVREGYEAIARDHLFNLSNKTDSYNWYYTLQVEENDDIPLVTERLFRIIESHIEKVPKIL